MSTETKGILIREAVPSDADELIAHVNALADEVGIYIALSSGEFKLTSDEERKFLEEFASSKNSIFLVADFEGEIPKGQYGAGTVKIWDKGVYEVKVWDEKMVEFNLNGRKIKGRYILVRLKKAGEKNWLLLKGKE